jgi:hypothetical protein
MSFLGRQTTLSILPWFPDSSGLAQIRSHLNIGIGAFDGGVVFPIPIMVFYRTCALDLFGFPSLDEPGESAAFALSVISIISLPL